MKKIFTLILGFISIGTAVSAQNRCGIMEYTQWQISQDPGLGERLKNVEKELQQSLAIQKMAKMQSNDTVYTIPVVVHVVWRTNAENISDEQILSQIKILNDDFGRSNADTLNTPAIWQKVGTKLPFRFQLAKVDPQGQPTSGIVRVKTHVSSFSTTDAAKRSTKGGDDAWDVSRYLNIWVCNLGSNLLGYGEFPSGIKSNTYGLICNYNAFGNMGAARYPYNQGRTATHEIGHCFNLFHIWGDDNGACTGTDYVDDTPNQGDQNYGCNKFPKMDKCAPDSNGVMFMNYMDYSDDACLNMFTKGQADRMVTTMKRFYPKLLNPLEIPSPQLSASDAGIQNAYAAAAGNCQGEVSVFANIKNYGSSTLNNADVMYKLDNNAAVLVKWQGNLLNKESIALQSFNISPGLGLHKLKIYTQQPNSNIDSVAVNDTSMVQFNMLAPQSGALNLPYAEGFENSSFPGTSLAVNNFDQKTTWVRTTASKYSGQASAMMNNFNYNGVNQVDELVLPNLNLSSEAAPTFTFALAYQMYDTPKNAASSDTLVVAISTDCGKTFNELYRKAGVNLSTANPAYSSTSFSPATDQWRQEIVDLGAYSKSTNAIIKFRHINGFQNQLYIDDIDISQSPKTKISLFPHQLRTMQVYPNPSDGASFLQLDLASEANVSVEMYDILGKKINEHSYGNLGAGPYDLNLPVLTGLADRSLILLKVKIDDSIVTKKMIYAAKH